MRCRLVSQIGPGRSTGIYSSDSSVWCLFGLESNAPLAWWSKDRLDKVFIDKFLLAKLTGKDVPHVAIFLNDVQRKRKNPQSYGVSSTFLPGRFKGYTIKLNPLDGVYYFDIRPNMTTEPILKEHIRTFDHFLFTEVWSLLKRKEAIVADVEPKENID
jgi:hypothetical protein